MIASMVDDSSTYGTRIFDLGLAEAVERSILAGFEIDVLEMRDPDPIMGLPEDALRGRRMAMLQTALVEHAAQQNLHTTMVFHQRVGEPRRRWTVRRKCPRRRSARSCTSWRKAVTCQGSGCGRTGCAGTIPSRTGGR
ncbi:hypothetical protein ACFWBV_34355 [Streptomyces sp. NPDC060030]|uniref:hypothetical protein n=1 Tax=Streptomyces sp. NPDC060030 TaxID=3347042 RepID=UPI003696B110